MIAVRRYAFIAKDFDVLEQYEQGFSVNDLFPVNSSGVTTHRDHFVIDIDRETLADRIQRFYNPEISDKEIAVKLDLKDSRDWKLSEAKNKGFFQPKKILKVLYRPFDCRQIYYDANLVEYGREKVMQHFIKGENTGLIVT